MLSINRLCEILNAFENASDKRENCDSYFIEGSYNESFEHLNKLTTFILNEGSGFVDFITLLIDGDEVSIHSFNEYAKNNHFPAIFELTIDTKLLIQETCSGNGDIDEYLFTSVSSFEANLSSLGMKTPLEHGKINQISNTRIHVYGLPDAFGGPALAIAPTKEPIYGDTWLQGSALPTSNTLLKQVHLVTNQNIHLELKNFELSWGAQSQEIARSFRLAFAQHLLTSLSTNFYTESKVQYKGVKHIDADISISEESNVSEIWLAKLTESVKWCYGTEDPSVPLQLFIDRLSLEYSDGSLLNIDDTIFENCLIQAKNNYRFVIAKRSDDYRKELKDIYSDIKTITDKFMEKSSNLSSELLKSLLTLGFVFTVGSVSKAVVNQELLHSKEGILLFKIMGIYLMVSFFIRWLNASAELKIAHSALNSWSKKLHSHISTDEIKNLINQQVKYSKLFYHCSLGIVLFIQGSLALASYYASGILSYLGL